jgi:NAD(P)-dependent dehydrogenase (short-subunit alcohol dehydrogenase family)
MAGKRVFVTGGGSGLGRALACRFARDGWRVAVGDLDAASARTVRKEIAGFAGEALAFRCDVTRERDLARVAGALSGRWGGVDVVVNNAGVAQADRIEETSLDDWSWILDVNLLGVVRGCKVFTPLFRKQGSGHFVNVASMAGLVHPPYMAAYNASKAAVVALSETLEAELEEHGIGVTVACPGFFRTNLGKSLRTGNGGLREMTDRLVARSPVTADEVADRIFRAVLKKEFWVLPHAEGEAAWLMKRLLPHGLFAWEMRRQTAPFRRAAGGSVAARKGKT